MLYIILLPASSLMIIWIILLTMVKSEDWVTSAYNRVFDNLAAIEKLRRKDALREQRRSQYHRKGPAVPALLQKKDSRGSISKLERLNERLQSGDFIGLSVIPMPGYVLQRRFEALGRGGIHKAIMTKCYELDGRKHAAGRARHLFARMLSYTVIGIAAALLAGVILLSFGSTTAGAAVCAIGSLLVLILVYAMFDNLSDRVKKRRRSIGRQFPNVVSKLALLVTSGMIMDRAWKDTAFSQETELYIEMRKTSQELDNLVSPEAAYAGFISRCNTKESAKLASAIMQNLSKGNAEIGMLLKDIAREAWLERRHSAKRDAEKANSKLMIPTMLLLAVILVMLLVPIAMSFSF